MNFYYSSHFSGCGGSTIGAKNAGFTPISAIEFDPKIAELYRANIGDTLVEDISRVNFKSLDIPTKKERNGDILVHQTSPPCQDFSIANKSANRSSDRANVLSATHDFYRLYHPDYVVLENVPAYRKASVCVDFENFLISMGYRIIKGIFNAADYGVPQTRERFLIIAVAADFPLPQITPTHGQQRQGQLSLFTQSWIGWYDAIRDLIPSLPDSHLTEKQKQAISRVDNLLIDSRKSHPPRCPLIDGQQKGVGGERQMREIDRPIWTIPASAHKGLPRIIERIGYYDLPKVAASDEPCWTLRATLGDDKHGGNRTKVIDAVLESSVVKSLDTKVLARLQSFPDWYQWSGKSAVDIRGIGNSIAPLLMQRICEAIKSSLN